MPTALAKVIAWIIFIAGVVASGVLCFELLALLAKVAL